MAVLTIVSRGASIVVVALSLLESLDLDDEDLGDGVKLELFGGIPMGAALRTEPLVVASQEFQLAEAGEARLEVGCIFNALCRCQVTYFQ